jgi:hypothetical protein
MIHSPENTMFFFWLGLTDQRSWKPKGSKSSAICRRLSGPLAEQNLGISSHHGFHILVTLMMVLVNGTIGVTIYTKGYANGLMTWFRFRVARLQESPMKIIPLNKSLDCFGQGRNCTEHISCICRLADSCFACRCLQVFMPSNILFVWCFLILLPL